MIRDIILSTFIFFSATGWGSSNLYQLAREDWYKIEGQREDRVIRKQSAVQKKKTQQIPSQKEQKQARKIAELKKKFEILKKQMLIRLDTPDVWDGSLMIRTGQMYAGELFLSELSTNLESPIVVGNIQSDLFPPDAQFICRGMTKHKRVQANCNLLVTDAYEMEVDVSLLSEDGSFGISGMYYDGKDEYVAGIIASEFAKGGLMVAQDRVTTALGETTRATTKNMLLQGMINSSNEVTDMMKEEMKTKEPKVFVKRGTRVIAYFNKGIDLNKIPTAPAMSLEDLNKRRRR